MSRIHEALKKAQLELGPAQFADGAVAVTKGESAVQGVLTHASVHTFASRADLRFEDVLAHCAHPEWHSDPRVSLLDSSQHVHLAEQFRILRSRLYQLSSQEHLKVILVTSAIPGEGKTFVAANLVQTIIRQKQRRALLIDADMRCSRQHLVLQAPIKPGLADYLRGDVDEMAVIQHGQEGNLCFIAGGQTVPNPNELLSTSRLKTLLAGIAPAFDWVIIDSPPCLPVADARVIADVCDAVILVVRAGSTPYEMAQKAHQTFEAKKILGVVLNCVEKDTLDYRSYYSSSYQSG